MGKAGRPSKYTEELLEKARAYVEGGYENEGHEIPSIAGLSVVLGISRDTIYDWQKQDDKAEFSDLMDLLLSRQELVCMSKGLNGKFNSTITKLVLAKHGYHDKIEAGFDPDKPAKFVLNMGKQIDKGEDDA